MLKKILIILYICIIGIMIYFAYDFFTSRNATTEESPIDRAQERLNKISKQDTTKNDSKNQDKKENSNENKDDLESDSIAEKETAYDITQSDCKNECTYYSDDKKEYCKNTCGLTGTTAGEKDCANLSGLQKDYCIRDVAVKNSDLDMCEEIEDGGIHNQCINRLTEDFIDQIM